MMYRNKPGCKVRLIGRGHAEGLGEKATVTPGGDTGRSFSGFQNINLRHRLAGGTDVFSYFWRAHAGWT